MPERTRLSAPLLWAWALNSFGIEGQTLLEDEPDSHTFDYALINAPIFFANTIEHYVFIQQLFLHARVFQRGKPGVHQFLHDWVTGMGTLEPEDWAWDELAAILSLRRVQSVNLLLSTYWTMGAVRHGEYVAKVRVAPAKEAAEKVTRRHLDPASAAEVFRPALVAELQERPYEFDYRCSCVWTWRECPSRMTVEWPEALSPFVTVARCACHSRTYRGRYSEADGCHLDNARVTEEHRPLGNIMRAQRGLPAVFAPSSRAERSDPSRTQEPC